MRIPWIQWVQIFRRNTLLRKTVIVLWHLAGIAIAYYLAFLLRFDGHIPAQYLTPFRLTVGPLMAVGIAVFALFRLYTGIWAYFSIHDVLRILGAVATSALVFVPVAFLALGRTFIGFPRSVLFTGPILLTAWMISGRLAIRLLRERHARGRRTPHSTHRSLLVGNLADVDNLIHGDLQHVPDIGRFVGIVTDEPGRNQLTMRGIRVRGSIAQIGPIARQTRADSILILPPYTRPREMNRIVASCETENVACDFRMIPSMADLASGKLQLSAIRHVELEDLLGRPEIAFDHTEVRALLAGKRVLITGAGGSIGSELVRQVAQYAPSTLVLLDNSEFNLYSIDMEIRKLKPALPVVSLAGDVGNLGLVRRMLRQHKIQVIFHAAAYKHVPIMEINVPSCIANNSLGSAQLVAEAEEAGVERFVLVSTDKAVRPTSVMGASKRIAERVIQERPKSATAFVTVRFGNVMGSSGSVIPLFRRQIAAGGPVTVTSEKATRFFMSIPEAVDLILQASTIGHDRDIMVLEMGESIRIAELARHMIELSGLRVGEDIEIVYTGMRPGEKEYEEVMTHDENVVRTPFNKIWVMRKTDSSTAVPPVDLDRLARLAASQDAARLREEIVRLIPEALPPLAPEPGLSHS